MSGISSTGVIAGLLEVWRRAFDEQRVSDLVSLFREDALFQGISPHLRTGREEISEYYDNVADGMTAKVEVLREVQLSEGIVIGFSDVTFTARTGETRPIRLSIVAEQVEGTWLIRQYHAATH
ncbi:SgcJ/EcaC family oxidoreductase [Nonomuraea jiangxiensis]|uniref:SnoaL-like domain-containing protein n=1 Tax=Nonomuraea jiangxiensis TaxID=633440 RepID=A0A1G9VT86_9ACTN|nr:SgcJ/EcaC family oxidoreductase [Nonomuraea jiangxiensis]SDM75380.1 conserved hypothetical protein [Nonomuraea jiangxiensis]